MPEEAGESDPFDAPHKAPPETLHVNLTGYEGPLDLLLDLARRDKIDLTKIQILPLAEQYLAFVAEAQRLRIELAADILVMAAWLAWLKSRLLAPQEGDDGPTGEEMADDLAFRLKRLEAMREAADALFARARLGRDVFGRGAPEAPTVTRHVRYRASLFDLLKAYGSIRQAELNRETVVEKRPFFSLVDARKVMDRLVGPGGEWMPLHHLISAMPPGEDKRAVLASTFGATLEMAREGRIAVRQSAPFAPLYIRGTEPGEADGEGETT